MKEREKNEERERYAGLSNAEYRRIGGEENPFGRESFHSDLSGLSPYEILQCEPKDRWEKIEDSYRRLMEECGRTLLRKSYPDRREVRRIILQMVALEEAYQCIREARGKNADLSRDIRRCRLCPGVDPLGLPMGPDSLPGARSALGNDDRRSLGADCIGRLLLGFAIFRIFDARASSYLRD